jgi:hypothetical protein
MTLAQVSISLMKTPPSASPDGSSGPIGPHSTQGMPAFRRCPVSRLAREPGMWTPTESGGCPRHRLDIAGAGADDRLIERQVEHRELVPAVAEVDRWRATTTRGPLWPIWRCVQRRTAQFDGSQRAGIEWQWTAWSVYRLSADGLSLRPGGVAP